MSLHDSLSKPADYNVSASRCAVARRVLLIAAVTLGATALGAQRPAAQESSLRVLGSNGVKAALEQLQSEVERHAGGRVGLTFGTSASTKQQITAGDAFDVAILTKDVIDELASAGQIVPASRASLGRSGIGIGMRAGAKRPDRHWHAGGRKANARVGAGADVGVRRRQPPSHHADARDAWHR
jgi:ABC-type molybdate transport system substrate-binding protein